MASADKLIIGQAFEFPNDLLQSGLVHVQDSATEVFRVLSLQNPRRSLPVFGGRFQYRSDTSHSAFSFGPFYGKQKLKKPPTLLFVALSLPSEKCALRYSSEPSGILQRIAC